MLALFPGIRRSCRMRSRSDASSFRRLPTLSSETVTVNLRKHSGFRRSRTALRRSVSLHRELPALATKRLRGLVAGPRGGTGARETARFTQQRDDLADHAELTEKLNEEETHSREVMFPQG